MIECPICEEHKSANAYYRMTIHENKYHELREKIHEKIEYLESGKIQYEGGEYYIIQELKSLLEEK